MTISNDPWHFPRTELAKQILGMFETGLGSVENYRELIKLAHN